MYSETLDKSCVSPIGTQKRELRKELKTTNVHTHKTTRIKLLYPIDCNNMPI